MADLITPDQAWSFMQKAPEATSQDAEIEAMISRASVAISNYCDREFATDTSGATTRTFEGYMGSQGLFVDFAPFDLQSASVVLLDTDQTAVTLTTAEYRLGPLPASDGVYTFMRLRPLRRSFGQIVFPQVQVQVTGLWGWPSVPLDVQTACLQTVSFWMKRDVQSFSRQLNVDSGIVAVPKGLPDSAQGLLAPFVRMAI